MRLVTVIALVALYTARAPAQTIETPVPFDSAQRVLAVTPGMADRLGLRAPVWPVVGEYREARLYSVAPSGGFTLVVLRPTGALERFTLSSTDRAALGGAVDAGIALAGRTSTESPTDMVSEPAGNAFARHLTVYSALFYGPLAASLSDDGPPAGALYLITTGLTYFMSYGAAQSNPFTRAQSDLAANLGLASAIGGLLSGYALTGDGEREVRALALGSGIVGTITGVGLGARLSDAEAHSTIMGVEVGAATGLAISGFATGDNQAAAIAAVVGGAVGLPVGMVYPRKASYTLTAGDVDAIGTTGWIGAGWAAATLGDGPSRSRIFATVGVGYLAGVFLGDRLLARPLNVTQSQANVLKLGAIAGGLVGVALPVLAGNESAAANFGAAAAGATLAVAALSGSFPASTRAGTSRLRSADWATRIGSRLSFSPASALGALGKTPGRHSILRITF
jgi:hypothetical protein